MKNWKTTLIGLGFGAGYMVLQGLAAGIKPKDLLIGVGIAALGAVAKDYNVTGKS